MEFNGGLLTWSMWGSSHGYSGQVPRSLAGSQLHHLLSLSAIVPQGLFQSGGQPGSTKI